MAREIEGGLLVPVLEAFQPPPIPIHIVHRAGPHSPAKLRAFIDLMAERLRGDPALGYRAG